MTREQIADMLIGAFEGGSNYWARSAEVRSRSGKRMTDVEICDHPRAVASVLIRTLDHPRTAVVLLPNDLRRGAKIMAREYPKHYADVLAENDDAWTADTFLQCCVFGKLVYA